MDSEDRKNNVGHKARVEDLERVVKVRKAEHDTTGAGSISQDRSVLSPAGGDGTCGRIGYSPSFIPTLTVSQAPTGFAVPKAAWFLELSDDPGWCCSDWDRRKWNLGRCQPLWGWTKEVSPTHRLFLSRKAPPSSVARGFSFRRQQDGSAERSLIYLIYKDNNGGHLR